MIWSLTDILVQVPSGAIADVVSRRLLLVIAPLVTGLGYTLWTIHPSYISFALGFVLWGTGGALRDGAQEALIYEELDRMEAADRYAHLIGGARALKTGASMVATAIAAPVMAVGGYPAIGSASVLACLAGSVVALTFPEHRVPSHAARDTQPEGFRTYVAMVGDGVGHVRSSRAVRRAVALLILLAMYGAMEEYVPLLAADTGVDETTVPLLILLVSLGMALGGVLGGSAARFTSAGLAGLIAGGALAMTVSALAAHPVGFIGLALGFGAFQMASVAADARLQRAISGSARATVTSMAGLGQEVIQIGIFAGYGIAAAHVGHPMSFAGFALPYLVAALGLLGWILGRRMVTRAKPLATHEPQPEAQQQTRG